MTCQLKIGWPVTVTIVWCFSLVINLSFTSISAAETYPTSNYTLEQKRLFIYNLINEPLKAAPEWGESACSPPADASKAENPGNYSIVPCPDAAGFYLGTQHSNLNLFPAMWVLKGNMSNCTIDQTIKIQLEFQELTKVLNMDYQWVTQNYADQVHRRGYKWLWLNDLVTDVMGPLLSLYALTNNDWYYSKAKYMLGELVLEEFYFKQTTADRPFPLKLVELYDRCEWGWSSDCWHNCSIHECSNLRRDDRFEPFPASDQWSISELGSMMLELNYLAAISNKPVWRERVSAIRGKIDEMAKANGNDMPYDYINTRSQTMYGDASLYEGQRHYYSGLIKSYIASNGTDKEALRLYQKALDQAERWGLFQIVPSTNPSHASNHWYHRSKYEADTDQVGRVRSTGASLGAMLALGANSLASFPQGVSNSTSLEDQYRVVRHWQLAKGLTDTYQAAAEVSKGLLPYVFTFEKYSRAPLTVLPTKYRPEHNHLSPDLAESFFILWRLTKEQKYRDYAWRLTEAIYYRCREFARKSGRPFRGTCLDDVGNGKDPVHWMNDPFSVHYSATLTFLYLTFTDDDVFPLDKWVFTSKGHPLPICGWHHLNRNCSRWSTGKPTATAKDKPK